MIENWKVKEEEGAIFDPKYLAQAFRT